MFPLKLPVRSWDGVGEQRNFNIKLICVYQLTTPLEYTAVIANKLYTHN